MTDSPAPPPTTPAGMAAATSMAAALAWEQVADQAITANEKAQAFEAVAHALDAAALAAAAHLILTHQYEAPSNKGEILVDEYFASMDFRIDAFAAADRAASRAVQHWPWNLAVEAALLETEECDEDSEIWALDRKAAEAFRKAA